MPSCSGVDVVLYVVVWVINTVVMLCLVVCHFVTFIKIVAWSLLSCCIIWWLNTKLWKEKHCASRQHTYHLVCFKRFHKSDLFQRSVIKSRTYWVLKGYRVYFLEWVPLLILTIKNSVALNLFIYVILLQCRKQKMTFAVSNNSQKLMSWGPVCGPPSNKRTRPPSEWDRHVLLCCDSADSGSSRSAQWRDGTVRTAKQNRYTIGGDRQLVSLTACKINVIKQWWMLNIHERLCVSVDWLNLILPLLLGFSLSDAVLQKKRWRIVMMDGRRPHFCAFQHWRSHDLWLGSRLVSWLLMPLQLKLALSAYCTTIFLFQACLFFNFHIVVVGSSGWLHPCLPEIQGGAKNGATISLQIFWNSMTELRGNWWISAILYAEHSH